jgi:NAD(P)-dependent dehydrogenase (short-subunit alcohol dehydrogenase family)
MSQQTALITGAANGIGWATAQAFAAAGYRIVIADIRPEDADSKARLLGPGHIGVGCDVSDEAEVRRTIGGLDRLDVLVNNAGIASPLLPTANQDLETFQRVLHIHLSGTFLMSREAFRLLSAQGGAIVNISSIAGSAGLPRRNAYGAAKAGIASMTRSMAGEWAGSGVRVNAVAPGYVETALLKTLIDNGSIDGLKMRRRIPMGRLAKPEEIASAILFLCSPAASYITGVTLTVDGGLVAFGGAPGDAYEGD